MSHHIAAFIAREFTNKMKQPTKRQEVRRAETVFVLLACHGRQTSERMHLKRVVMVKSEFSRMYHEVCKRKRERMVPTNVLVILFISSVPVHAF